MRQIITTAVIISTLLCSCCASREPRIHATWDGARFTCPPNLDEWASEREAERNGRDYVYCVPRPVTEREPFPSNDYDNPTQNAR